VRECQDARLDQAYLQGLVAARDAYRAGGSEDALAPVRKAVSTLEAGAARGARTAETGRIVLLAAASAAQSERDDMKLMLDHATSLERRQLAAQPGASLPVTAHEVAGDLWLQVHRFDDARQAYEAAAALVGPTPRVTAGLARVAVRLKDEPSACRWYGELMASWKTRSDTPAEVLEARQYMDEHACRQ
jgi:hypothetical protein